MPTPKLIYRSHTISLKISTEIFIEIHKLVLKFMWTSKRTRIATTILKNNKTGGLTLTDFKGYYISAVIKISVVLETRWTYRTME